MISNLQKAELDILKQVLVLCQKHNIEYYILGGTLLGAVRHKGFIPWDDDIDIGMKRDEYERFIEIAKKELPSNLILDYYKEHKGEKDYSSYYMVRIENTKVKMKCTMAKQERIINSWIDVFPIDGLPNNKIKKFFHKLKLLYLRMTIRYSQYSKLVTQNEKKKDFFVRMLIKLGRIIDFEKIFNKDKELEKLDKTLKKYNPKDCDEIINFAGACKSYRFIEIFPKKIYDELAEYDFEDIKLVGPKDYNAVLSHQYGDYMTLPKEEDRNKHNTEVIYEKGEN